MTTSPPGARIVVSKDGPYIVSGDALLADQTIVTDAQGNSQSWEEGNKYSVRKGYALCRCGHSDSKPFCDGTHTKIGFDGTETASRASYLDQAKAFDGPALRLTDAERLCASALKGKIGDAATDAMAAGRHEKIDVVAIKLAIGRLTSRR
jgi:CDGSH-type Zn-finger protein